MDQTSYYPGETIDATIFINAPAALLLKDCLHIEDRVTVQDQIM